VPNAICFKVTNANLKRKSQRCPRKLEAWRRIDQCHRRVSGGATNFFSFAASSFERPAPSFVAIHTLPNENVTRFATPDTNPLKFVAYSPGRTAFTPRRDKPGHLILKRDLVVIPQTF
jgi:hypothetical protein